jgi:hypothetical protein
MLEVLGIKNYQQLVPVPEDMKPTDPVSENQNILMNKPVKAFIEQNHQAHITVHMSAMQDPKIQAIVGMNPQLAQQLQMAMMAHVNEHIGFEYRLQVERAMGVQLPPMPKEGEEPKQMPPEIADQIAQLAAQASQQLLMQNQQEAKAAEAARMAQDPIIQMQQQELQIKQGELQRKAAKDQLDAMLKQQQLEVERERIASQARTAGAQMAVKVSADKEKMQMDQRKEGAKAGLEAMKLERTFAQQKEIADRQTKKGK